MLEGFAGTVKLDFAEAVATREDGKALVPVEVALPVALLDAVDEAVEVEVLDAVDEAVEVEVADEVDVEVAEKVEGSELYNTPS